jgi:hypothetical protein
VYWTFEIVLWSKGSASGIATIEGLPFNKGVFYGFHHAVGCIGDISVPSGQWLSTYVRGSTVYLVTNTDAHVLNSNFADNSLIRTSGFYFI